MMFSGCSVGDIIIADYSVMDPETGWYTQDFRRYVCVSIGPHGEPEWQQATD